MRRGARGMRGRRRGKREGRREGRERRGKSQKRLGPATMYNDDGLSYVSNKVNSFCQ